MRSGLRYRKRTCGTWVKAKAKEDLMCDDKNDEVKKAENREAEDGKGQEPTAPVNAICDGASANAAAQVDDDSEIKPVEGFFLTSQRWH
jgi:hypothetical protein